MDELIAQLKRIADAQEAQVRFNQEWMTYNQSIHAWNVKCQEEYQKNRAEDLQLYHQRRDEEREGTERYHVLALKQAERQFEDRMREVEAMESLHIPGTKFSQEDLQFLYKEISHRMTQASQNG